jgi:hypothetical protein
VTQPVDPEDHPLQPEDEDSDLRYDHRTDDGDGGEAADEDDDDDPRAWTI